MKLLLMLFVSAVIGNSAKALTNSQPAISDELQSVVFIAADGKDQDGATVNAYCNATFVHPMVLVTAAHCLRDAYVMKSFTTTVEVGKYKFVTKPDGSTVRIGYVSVLKEKKSAKFIFTSSLTARINSQGTNTQIGPNEDLALIVLNSPMNLPESVKMMTVVGQKELSGLAAIATQYAPTVITINPFEYLTTNDTKQFGTLNDLQWNSAGYFKSVSSSRVQEGDSGAPLLVKIGNTWKLVGVVKGKATTGWSDWDVFSGLDQKICEMANQVKSPEITAVLCR